MRISAAILAGALAVGEAAAAPAGPTPPPQTNLPAPRQTPLPPGGAASMREAQGLARPLLYWGLGGAVIVAGVLLLYDDDDGTSTTATTGTD